MSITANNQLENIMSLNAMVSVTDILGRIFKVKVVGITNFNGATRERVNSVTSLYSAFKPELFKDFDENKMKSKIYYIVEQLSDTSEIGTINQQMLFWDDLLKIDDCYIISNKIELKIKIEFAPKDIHGDADTNVETIINDIETYIKKLLEIKKHDAPTVIVEKSSDAPGYFTQLMDGIHAATKTLNDFAELESVRQIVRDLKSEDTIANINEIKKNVTELAIQISESTGTRPLSIEGIIGE